ncbi:MAG: hypothetical protein ACJAXA_001473 [Candidatus Aldehydirespiratoraceae bacterium]|jgi:hypothetical protein
MDVPLPNANPQRNGHRPVQGQAERPSTEAVSWRTSSRNISARPRDTSDTAISLDNLAELLERALRRATAAAYEMAVHVINDALRSIKPVDKALVEFSEVETHREDRTGVVGLDDRDGNCRESKQTPRSHQSVGGFLTLII